MKRIILRVLLKLRILHYLNFTVSIKKFGRVFNIPLVGTTGVEYFFNENEIWMVTILEKVNKLTQGKGTFIDVGANIGQTLLKVKCFSNDWEYVGFEPNPSCLQYLDALLKANCFVNTRLLPFGLSDRPMVANLSRYNDSAVDSSASVIPGFRSNVVASLTVPLISCDEIPELFQHRVAVVKIDVEGGELEVLLGLRSIIKRDQPLLVCEVLPVYEDGNELRLSRQLKLEHILDELCYVKFKIYSDGRLAYCEKIGIHSSLENVNYLFCPELASSVIADYFEIVP